MADNDTATGRPAWAHDAMSDDDIAFVEGYIDAIGWMPSAKADELNDFLCLSRDPRLWFEMDETHGLARYKGWNNSPGGIVGITEAKRNKRGVEIGYTAGVVTALRIHRPDLDREDRVTELDIQRKKIAATLARQKAKLAKVDAELAGLGKVD